MSLQLQRATAEMNRTKDSMKAVQNDLTHADKEISVRHSTVQLHSILISKLVDRHISVIVLCDDCVHLWTESEEESGDPSKDPEYAYTHK